MNRIKRKWWIPVGLLLFAGGIALAIVLRSDQEARGDPGPGYNGRTVSDWINSIQIGNESDAASTNLIEIGEPAVPYLIKAVEWKPSIRDKLSSFIGRHGRGMWAYRLRCLIDPEFAKWPETLRQKHISKRGALYVLRVIGSPATEALPALRRVARDEDWSTRTFALSAIRGVGPEVRDFSLFARALDDKHPFIRSQGARGLGQFRTHATEARALLRRNLSDEDVMVREAARSALEKLEREATVDATSQ